MSQVKRKIQCDSSMLLASGFRFTEKNRGHLLKENIAM